MKSIPWIVCVALFIVLSVTQLAEANQYFVGGSKDIGWNDKPKKYSYNHWSKKTKFAVNDTIVFTYPLGKDTVLYVRKEDYKKCNNKNPVKTWNDGKTEVNLFQTGIYHFIGGNDGSCQKGQRLIVFVPEIQPPATAPSPATASSPAAAPSPLSPPVPSTPPPTQKAPSLAPSISHPPESSPPPAPPTATAPSPADASPAPAPYAPAPAPSSASIATWTMLAPVGLMFGVLFY